MRARFATALVGLPLILGTAWLGSPWFSIVVVSASVIAVAELRRMAQRMGIDVPLLPAVLWAVAFVVNAEMASRWGNLFWAIALAVMLESMVRTHFGRNRAGRGIAWAYNVFVPLYAGMLPAYAVLLRNGASPPGGWQWLYFALLVTFATDSGAFFTGLFLGRHRLAPHLSPHKTWEGAIGGLALAGGVAVLLSWLLSLPLEIWEAVALGLSAGIAAEVGDLLESWLKRRAGVKDASGLLPGHGGVLDRIDSLALAVPLIYYWLRTVLQI